MDRSPKYKINITKRELLAALGYAEKKGLETITLSISHTEVGAVINASATYDSKETDITDYGSW